MKKPFPFKIGADPEINLIRDGWSLNAKQEIKKLFRGQKEGYMGFETEKGNIGWDRWEQTAELRPQPENTPMGLTGNIQSLIDFLIKKRPEWDLSTLSDPDPVGGHLHFEIDKNTFADQLTINRIHHLMQTFFLILVRAEDKYSTEERMRRFENAKKINTKFKPETDTCTYEFKRPNAEWLVTPKLAQSYIAFHATIYHEIRKRMDELERQTDIHPQTIEKIEEGVWTGNKLMLRVIERLKENVRRFEYYPDYKKEIEYLFQNEKVLEDKERLNFNISKQWQKQIIPRQKR